MEQLSLIKNSVKKDTNKATVGIIVYTAIMTVVVLVHAIVATVIQIIKDPKSFLNPDGEAFESFVGRLAESALSTIIGVAAGVLFLSLFFILSPCGTQFYQIYYGFVLHPTYRHR